MRRFVFFELFVSEREQIISETNFIECLFFISRQVVQTPSLLQTTRTLHPVAATVQAGGLIRTVIHAHFMPKVVIAKTLVTKKVRKGKQRKKHAVRVEEDMTQTIQA